MAFSLAKLLGIDRSIDATHAAAADLIDSKIQPLIQEAENRIGGIGESLLDRLDGATLTLSLRPIPKATAVNPDPDRV